MFLSKTTLFLICSVVLVVSSADKDVMRTKRQAPNINVHQIPQTSFSCTNRKVGEYYADPEANCQVYHVCVPGMHNKMSLISFVCPNGTIFSQATRVCTPYERVDCSLTAQFYDSVHGSSNNRLTNLVLQPPAREPDQPPRQQSRTTTSLPPPRDNRFRPRFSGPSPSTSPRANTVARGATTPPVFRQPVRPVQPSIAPPTPRPAVSTSTSSYSYEYEYEYDYEDDGNQGISRNKREAIGERLSTKENYRKTSFSCKEKVAGSVYADIESNCKYFYVCVPVGKNRLVNLKVSCGNGTAFDQETGSCRATTEFQCQPFRFSDHYGKENQSKLNKNQDIKSNLKKKDKKS